jgi:hypothetical protein
MGISKSGTLTAPIVVPFSGSKTDNFIEELPKSIPKKNICGTF